MDTFAFIIHPIDPKRDVSRKYPLLGKYLSESQINFFSTFFPPVYISEIEGVVSQATGKQVKGWFIACPLTPRRMLELPKKMVYHKIIQTGQMAESLGANILGLGDELRRIPAKGADDVHVQRHRRQPLGTANNMGDSHQVVIDHGRQVISRQAI